MTAFKSCEDSGQRANVLLTRPSWRAFFRRGQTLSGIEDSLLDRSLQIRGCGSAGRDAGLQGSACFENCETEFRYSKCIRQGGAEAPVLWVRVAKYVLRRAGVDLSAWCERSRGYWTVCVTVSNLPCTLWTMTTIE